MIMRMTGYATWQEAPAYQTLRMFVFQCESKHHISKDMLRELNVHPYEQTWNAFLAHAGETWVMRGELEAAEKASKGFVYHTPSPSKVAKREGGKRILDTKSAQESVPLQRIKDGVWQVNQSDPSAFGGRHPTDDKSSSQSPGWCVCIIWK